MTIIQKVDMQIYKLIKYPVKIYIIIFLWFLTPVIKSQTYSVSGYVEDQKTGESIIGAFVIDSISKKGTSTNNFGFFHISNVNSYVVIKTTYLGFQSQVKRIYLQHDTILTFTINPISEIKEVLIEATPYRHDENAPLGLTIIPVKSLKSMPAMGESDLLKSIQTQPGIQGGIEGSAGIFVRGGGAGENLYLLDDVPIYNVYHLYGFFSAFNTSAVKDLELIKGNFPARYGGRTSSVIDVRSLDGNNKSIQGEVSIGILSSRFTLQGPLFSDKTTFMISARRSYFDIFTEPLKRNGILQSTFPNYNFYDINACVTHNFSKNDKIYLSFYNGKDHIITNTINDAVTGINEIFSENGAETSGWGNLVGSLRWNHLIGNQIFVNTTLATSIYNYFIQDQYNSLDKNLTNKTSVSRNYLSNYSSGILDIIAKTDVDYFISNHHRVRFGLGVTWHTFNSGRDKYTMNDQLLNEKTDTIYANSLIYANDYYLYAEDEMKIGEKTEINVGIRLSRFSTTTSRFINPEPRFSANYKIIPGLIVKTGYSRMVQYMHLLSSYNVSWPSDLWIPASNGIKPLTSDQINMGLAYNYKKIGLFTMELYRKWLNNTADFQNGASLTTEFVPWFDKVTQGNGNTKGLEISIEKQQGSITGRINYTLSSSDRTYADLNNGVIFPFSFDRRHDFNIFANYTFSPRWDVSALWIYATGYPVTVATVKYLPQLTIYNGMSQFGDEIDYYPSLNNFRLPAYQRLDIGIHLKKQAHRVEYLWSFDIFNALNRKNPDFMYIRLGYPNYIAYSSLLPIIPSINLTIKWK